MRTPRLARNWMDKRQAHAKAQHGLHPKPPTNNAEEEPDTQQKHIVHHPEMHQRGLKGHYGGIASMTLWWHLASRPLQASRLISVVLLMEQLWAQLMRVLTGWLIIQNLTMWGSMILMKHIGSLNYGSEGFRPKHAGDHSRSDSESWRSNGHPIHSCCINTSIVVMSRC